MSTLQSFASLFVLFQLSGVAFSACDDGKNNVVQLADASSNNPIQVTNGFARTYDSKKQPSCYKNVPDLELPGTLQLISGTIDVKKKYSLIGNSKALLTLKKNSFIIGTVCQDGKSKNILVPDSDCNFDICAASKALCTTLETVGVHKLGDLEGDTGINGTIPLPGVSSALKPLLRGQWKVEVKLQSGNDVVLHVEVPSNGEWLWLDEN